MRPPSEWPLGLAALARRLDRDLQRAARAAGGPAQLWSASPAEAAHALRSTAALATGAPDPRGDFDAARARAELRVHGIGFVGRPEPAFPAPLAAIHDPPFGLFVRGATRLLAQVADRPAVAIVGSRRATGHGLRLARALAAELAARGAVVVSGLAHGVDAAAHEGALAAGGDTLAVLGSGLDVPYPRRNARLAARIAEAGLLVSEYWPGTPPAPWRFPARKGHRPMNPMFKPFLLVSGVSVSCRKPLPCVHGCVHRI